MPGNELGDRVHNFFAQDNQSQGQHQSHVPDGNWPVLNSNFWAGSQRQIDALNPNTKNYPSQNAEIDRGQASFPVHVSHGMNFSQTNPRPDISRSQYVNEQPYSNGIMYGNQLYQTRQNQDNFRAMDTDSNQRHLIAPRGLSVHEQQEKVSDRSENSIARLGFDLFGGQPQMNHQQASMLQALQQRQQSGNLNDMQQQIMIRKRPEFQMQQLDLRPQDQVNQTSTSPSNSDALQYPWTAEPGTSWLSRGGSSSMQGSHGGLVFPPDLSGQTQRLMDLVPQQADQSLYGVPVSSSRGLAVNQYSQMATDRSSTLQMETFSNSLHGSQHNFMLDLGQEGNSVSRPKFQNGNSQSLNTGMADMGGFQPANSMQRNAPQQHFPGRQEVATRSEILHEVALDPAEEKILFGSDDNLWAAFGKSTDMSGEAGNLFDNGGLSNGFPSIQSGSWSALMQSAVEETSRSDVAPQEEWSGLNFHNADGSLAKQPTLMHNGDVTKASLPNDDMRIPSSLNSGSIRPSEDINTVNVMRLNQLGHKFQREPGLRVSSDQSKKFRQALEEASKWSNHSPLQKSVAEGSQAYGNASQHSLDAERTKLEQNGWNSVAAVPPGGDRAFGNHEAELSQQFQNNLLMAMQGGAHGSSLRNPNSITSSAIEFAHVKVGNNLADKGHLSLDDASASVANSGNTRVVDGTGSFVQNSNLLNQWTSAYPPAKFQGSDGLGGMPDGDKDEVRRHDMENCAMKENSNDSHHSNLSQQASVGFREVGLSDASDSRSRPTVKQKKTNKLANKASVPRKFQYHPLGNLDEDVGPTFGLKQPTQVQASSLQNTHFGQSSQVSRFSALTDKGELPKDNKGTNEQPFHHSFHGSAPKMSFPFSQPLDSYPLNKASSPSQNMLELIYKVDQSRFDGAVTHRNSSEGNISSLPHDAEKSDGSAGYIQHGQSSVSKGFGLQLGPPSQRLHIPDLASPSQNARDLANSMHTSHASAETGEKMVPSSSVPFPIVRSQYENENNLYKVPGNYHPSSGSDTSYVRSQLENKQITRVSGKMAMNDQIDSPFSCNNSHSTQRGSAETVLPNASHNNRNDIRASYVGTAGVSDIQGRNPAETAPTMDQIRRSQHFGGPGISRQDAASQVLQNIWNNVSSSQHTMAAQHPIAPSHFLTPTQPNIVESSGHGDLHVSKGNHLSSELSAIHPYSRGGVDEKEHMLKESSGQVASFVNIDSTSKVEESLSKASSIKDNLEDSPANSASTPKDIEAFGRSLKPNVFSNKNSALLNQMKDLKDAQNDPSIRVSKRMKGPDETFDARHVHLEAGQKNEDNVEDTLGSSAGVPSEDSWNITVKNTSPHGNIASQDIVTAGLDASQNNPSTDFIASVRVEHNQGTPQMVPSWFNQYGPFKNGQMLSIYNAHKATSLRPEEPSFTLGNSSSIFDAPILEENNTAAPIGVCEVGSTLKSASTSVSNENLSSAQKHQVILRTQKRKTATSELHPWHREISDGSQNFSVLSAAEGDWNKAANCLTEKPQDNGVLFEDGSPQLRSKRRLMLTTQLMQQLFHPPPETVLSADASSTHESVIYAVSRVALGDACSAVARSSDLGRRDCPDIDSTKGKQNGDPRFANAIEDLLGKAGKQKDDFLRLDKSASVLELRVECKDLEKFSLINRFAKFHGRGQTDNSEASTTITQKPYVQRYVTALPMPKNLPDRVQCLSL